MAVHLEFVSDLTSEAIIATFERFFARIGKGLALFINNVTNFVGASTSTEVKLLHKLVNNEEIYPQKVSAGNFHLLEQVFC